MRILRGKMRGILAQSSVNGQLAALMGDHNQVSLTKDQDSSDAVDQVAGPKSQVQNKDMQSSGPAEAGAVDDRAELLPQAPISNLRAMGAKVRNVLVRSSDTGQLADLLSKVQGSDTNALRAKVQHALVESSANGRLVGSILQLRDGLPGYGCKDAEASTRSPQTEEQPVAGKGTFRALRAQLRGVLGGASRDGSLVQLLAERPKESAFAPPAAATSIASIEDACAAPSAAEPRSSATLPLASELQEHVIGKMRLPPHSTWRLAYSPPPSVPSSARAALPSGSQIGKKMRLPPDSTWLLAYSQPPSALASARSMDSVRSQPELPCGDRTRRMMRLPPESTWLLAYSPPGSATASTSGHQQRTPVAQPASPTAVEREALSSSPAEASCLSSSLLAPGLDAPSSCLERPHHLLPSVGTWLFSKQPSTIANDVPEPEARQLCASAQRPAHFLPSVGTWFAMVPFKEPGKERLEAGECHLPSVVAGPHAEPAEEEAQTRVLEEPAAPARPMRFLPSVGTWLARPTPARDTEAVHQRRPSVPQGLLHQPASTSVQQAVIPAAEDARVAASTGQQEQRSSLVTAGGPLSEAPPAIPACDPARTPPAPAVPLQAISPCPPATTRAHKARRPQESGGQIGSSDLARSSRATQASACAAATAGPAIQEGAASHSSARKVRKSLAGSTQSNVPDLSSRTRCKQSSTLAPLASDAAKSSTAVAGTAQHARSSQELGKHASAPDISMRRAVDSTDAMAAPARGHRGRRTRAREDARPDTATLRQEAAREILKDMAGLGDRHGERDSHTAVALLVDRLGSNAASNRSAAALPGTLAGRSMAPADLAPCPPSVPCPEEMHPEPPCGSPTPSHAVAPAAGSKRAAPRPASLPASLAPLKASPCIGDSGTVPGELRTRARGRGDRSQREADPMWLENESLRRQRERGDTHSLAYLEHERLRTELGKLLAFRPSNANAGHAAR